MGTSLALESVIPVLPDSLENLYKARVRLLTSTFNSLCRASQREGAFAQRGWLLVAAEARVCLRVHVRECCGALVTGLLFRRCP